MKSLKLLNLLGTLGLLLFAWGCGSNTPFQRGKTIATEGTSKIEKPSPERSINPSPTPTLQPPPPPSLNRTYFTNEILPMLSARKINGTTKGCSFCHSNPAATFEEAERLVVLGHPEQSQLFMRATGAEGANHEIWKPDSPEALKLMLWISGRAL